MFMRVTGVLLCEMMILGVILSVKKLKEWLKMGILSNTLPNTFWIKFGIF